jgi:hypothetical protein
VAVSQSLSYGACTDSTDPASGFRSVHHRRGRKVPWWSGHQCYIFTGTFSLDALAEQITWRGFSFKDICTLAMQSSVLKKILKRWR